MSPPEAPISGESGRAEPVDMVRLRERFEVVLDYPTAFDTPTFAEWKRAMADALLDALFAWRDEAFGPGNDKVWGPGEWVRCAACPDSTGLPSYHHKAFHDA